MEEGRSYLKPRWWRKVRRAYEELKEDTNNFTTKEGIKIEDIQTNRYKLIALRLISGLDRQTVAYHIGCHVQDLANWEDGKAKKDLEYDKANKLLLFSKFEVIGERYPTNLFITRFFEECSILDMKRDYIANRRLRVLFIATMLFLVPLLATPIVGSFLGSIPGVALAFAFLGWLVLFFAMALVILPVYSRLNPLLDGSFDEQLTYANRLLKSRDDKTRRCAERLLRTVARFVRRKARASVELQDLKELYMDSADSIQQRLIPHIRNYRTLNKERKQAVANMLGRLAEHFFSPTMESALSLRPILQKMRQEFPEELTEVRKERRVAKSVEDMDRRIYYENPIGRIALDSANILCGAFIITSSSWFFLGFDPLAAVGLFSAISIVLSTLRVAHLRSR